MFVQNVMSVIEIDGIDVVSNTHILFPLAARSEEKADWGCGWWCFSKRGL